MIRRTYDVFISYTSKDRETALDIHRRLKRAKLKVWLDKARLAGGDDFGDEIEVALERSRAVAILQGSSGIGPYQKNEIARAAKHKGLRLIPVLLPGLRRIPRTPIELERLHRIDLRKGIDKVGMDQLIAAIKNKAPKAVAPEKKPTPRRKKARPSAKAPADGGSIIAVNGIAAKTIKGIVTVGNHNTVRVGSRGW